MDEIEKVYQESEVLQHPYQHIKLLFATPKSTLVPGAFFDENNPESFFNFNHELKKNEKVYANYIYGNESHIVYSLPDVVSNYFLGRYPQIRIYHQACPFIDELLLKNKAQSDFKSVYLNIYPAFFDVAWLHNAELQLFNSFAYRNLVDFQYFLLNVFEQLKLSVVDIPVIITGFVQKNDPKVEMIRKYFKKVDYLEHPDHFSYAYGFNEHPNHYFTNMLNLYQCG